jgi:hypothetical protein
MKEANRRAEGVSARLASSAVHCAGGEPCTPRRTASQCPCTRSCSLACCHRGHPSCVGSFAPLLSALPFVRSPSSSFVPPPMLSSLSLPCSRVCSVVYLACALVASCLLVRRVRSRVSGRVRSSPSGRVARGERRHQRRRRRKIFTCIQDANFWYHIHRVAL